MSTVRKKFGKQQKNAAKLGTENRRTHDVKPTTLNPKLKTELLAGPIFSFKYIISNFRLGYK